MDVDKDGVHEIHCCLRHGCGYGEDERCAVALGLIKQLYPCEVCANEAKDPLRIALQDFVESFEGDFVLYGEIVDNPDQRWGELTRLYQGAKKALDE